MAVAELRRKLSRRMYVRSRVARAAAVRIAYLAYSRALLRWDDPSSPAAAALSKIAEGLASRARGLAGRSLPLTPR